MTRTTKAEPPVRNGRPSGANMIQHEKVTTVSALGAVATPLWLPSLADVSQTCAIVAPILGVAWLVFQFALKIRELRKR